ncbi:MAG: AAA family ATPase [Planctomycetia bacterium]|nr:AAA family ATPase [Planctomycetia bacterium]
MPQVVVLAGSNGAGKTTASRAVLRDVFQIGTFVNADFIAQGLNGFDPNTVALQAGRLMLQRLHELAAEEQDFAFETTLSGKTYAPWLRSLQDAGYRVSLLYYWLESPDLAVARVAARVRRGGHHVPEATIRQRWTRSVENLFQLYLPLADDWSLFNNTHDGEPRLIATGYAEVDADIHDPVSWNLITKAANYDRPN